MAAHAATPSTARPRVLALHGSSQTAEILSSRLERLAALFSSLPIPHEIVYVDGPHVLPLRDGDQVATRTWYERGADGRASVSKSLGHLATVWSRHGPFQGVIAFSAGCVAARAVAGLPGRFPGLAWVMLASSPDLELGGDHAHVGGGGPATAIPAYVRSLHVYGEADRLVEAVESERVMRWFEEPEAYRHQLNHAFPVRAVDLARYGDFVRAASVPDGSHAEVQIEEMESLRAIYGDDLEDVVEGETATMSCAVKLSTGGTKWEGRTVRLRFAMPPRYPDAPPTISLDHDMGMLEFPSEVGAGVLKAVRKSLADVVGSPMVFEAVCVASAYLQDYREDAVADDISDEDESADEAAEEDDSVVVSPSASTSFKSKNARGLWRHTIGLVGKPSAGKSTFFNCATRSTLAKVAAHPFTTIDPNIAGGWYRVPISLTPTAWPENRRSKKLMPCRVKDVAGLVQGACQGRGRGNQFLNDLCDADVLIHVVDASGQSDADGNILNGDTSDGNSINGSVPDPTTSSSGDPMSDVRWVRRELHEWILGNITRKWSSILRKPSKLADMFSGYQSPRWLTDEALRLTGFDPSVSPVFAKTNWSLSRLSACVDRFLTLRFPTLLALNKADLPTAPAHIARLRAAHAEGESAPVCAAAEAWLQAQVRAGKVRYEIGDATAERIVPCETAAEETEWARATAVLATYGGTGVLEALTAAVMLRAPVLAYPVEDLGTLRPAGAEECVSLKLGTTVADLFEVLSHGDGASVAGQFVRCEGMALDGGQRRPLKKEAEIDGSCAVVKLMSNRKSRWQHGLHPPDA
ncbi:hypothetical protein HK101_012002 [Irineochytrium annulatum]|nr:hypothetical protein HK101_012002 [Irineochytrium annulatum]